ncbi:MAG: serine/threonine protein kinase [Myxococcales bacterium]|nr:serine/threonine protein kinase [Myxococcales bacterium]
MTDDAKPDDDDLIGAILGGRYRIEKKLAEGGMGRVFYAMQLGLERKVAIKLLHAHLMQNSEYKRRFEREARAMTAFTHPGMVAVHDFGEFKGMLYLVMELLDGVTLLDLLEDQFPFAPERTIDLVAQICEVLAAAHEVGMVHRDLKPENVIVTTQRDGRETVKILDFGLAIMVDQLTSNQRITKDGMISGTPYYMSPEHCSGRELDGRSDIYALGAILYEILCGEVPFSGENAVQIFTQHLFKAPELPSKMRPDLLIPAALEEIAITALAKKPDERFATADEFRERLLDAGAILRGEAPSPLRKRNPKKGSRSARIEALGLPTVEARAEVLPELDVRPVDAADGAESVVVIERIEVFADSLTALLRANDFAVQQVSDLPNALVASGGARRCVIVLDIRAEPMEWLGRLAAQLELLDPARVRVVVVGPTDPIEPMHRAVGLHLEAYITPNVLASKLPSTLRRSFKRLKLEQKRGNSTP